MTLHQWVQQGMPVLRYCPWVRFGHARVRQWLADNRIAFPPEVSPAQASRPLPWLLQEVEAGRLSAVEADRVFHDLDLPPA